MRIGTHNQESEEGTPIRQQLERRGQYCFVTSKHGCYRGWIQRTETEDDNVRADDDGAQRPREELGDTAEDHNRTNGDVNETAEHRGQLFSSSKTISSIARG